LYDIYRGQETDEKFASEGGTTWAEQTDAEERAAAAERQVYSVLCHLVYASFINLKCVLLLPRTWPNSVHLSVHL